MSKIYKTTDDFPFHELTIGKPVSAPGGNFFIRYSMDETPLYVQPPKCLVKQVLNKTGKRIYCDFVFQQENEQFIRWMENLENKSQQLLFKNKNQWFESDLDIQDIENSFTSPLKIYKSGKSYIVRTNIQSRNGRPIVKIYDEDEKDVLLDQIQENMGVMVILEIQGIRCSPRSFQIDIELKQMMVLKPDDLFDTCILKSRKIEDLGNSGASLPALTPVPLLTISQSVTEPLSIAPVVPSAELSPSSVSVDLFEPKPVIPSSPTSIPAVPENIENESSMVSPQDTVPDSEPISSTDNQETILTATSISSIPEESIELCEVDFDLDEMSETDTISIKQRKDVYYEMYREALRKAKVAKDLALSAYLEAKHIKNKYMLDDISDEEEEESVKEDSADDSDENEENQE
jgi:hypothetical protein